MAEDEIGLIVTKPSEGKLYDLTDALREGRSPMIPGADRTATVELKSTAP